MGSRPQIPALAVSHESANDELGGLLAGQRRDRILLVDDDSLTRLLTRSALEERGFDVAEAGDGEAALAILDIFAPDIILLDALMTGMDGFDTCRALRARADGENMPVLMLTGLDDECSVSAAYEAGANDFFVKSTQWTLLAERIRYLLRASRMRAELVRSESRVSKAQRIARLGIWEWDISSNLLFPSKECFELVDLEPADKGIPMSTLRRCLHIDDKRRLMDFFAGLLKGNQPGQFDCRLVRRDGGMRIVHIDAEVELDNHGRAVKVHGITQDITDRREAEDRIRHLANYDSLTGLPNRRLFREQLAHAMERAQRNSKHVAILFIDLDNFKRINDTLGHSAGDTLLREIATRLSGSLRVSDRVARDGQEVISYANSNSVARLGGDEFTILVSDIAQPEDAESIAKRILDTLHRPVVLSGQECFISASIGIAISPRDGDDVDTMLRNADMAMYSVKQAGRNGLKLYTPQIDSATREKLEVSNALHKAIERNELRLFYQPQIDVESGRVIAAEALMRWQREDRLVFPDEFIPAACETGLILPMGDWAIAEACAQVRRWREAGLPQLPIAVNITANAFQTPGFVAKVQKALADEGVGAEYLELEITETMLMQDLKQSLPTLHALTDLGVKLSVDDFGTGYSSLSYLRKLPIDTLKIDRSFVRDMYEGSDDEAIVAAIAALARALHLRVIAEGVETQTQADLLKTHGCGLMQGYFFSKPMPIEAFNQYTANPGLSALPSVKPQTVTVPRKK